MISPSDLRSISHDCISPTFTVHQTWLAILMMNDELGYACILQFEEGVNPTAYAFAVVEQRGGKDNLSLRTFVAGEIKNLNVARPVKSLRLQRFASILSTSDSFLWILKVSSVVTKDCLSFHACLSY